MKKIVIVAHRGKGPTSKLTAPTEELWFECKSKKLLIDQAIVPQKILAEHKIGLPKNIPPENTIAAFRQGLEEGADAIELDIFLSSDNIPIVIHDNELNRNVSGARREAKNPEDLGFLKNVQDYLADDLKQFDMWGGNIIPTLQEVINFTALFNKIRITKHQAPIILNIEFKSKEAGNVPLTLNVINQCIKDKKIESKNVIYCSFDHEALEQALEIDKNSQVATALKTVYLFGKKQVEIKNNWTVELGVPYKKSAIEKLKQLIDRMQKKGSLVGLDAVLWDIDNELVDLAVKYNLDLHASTSDFRDFSDRKFISNLIKISKKVNVFFKTDEPVKIRKLVEEVIEEDGVNLPSVKITKRLGKISFDEDGNDIIQLADDPCICRLPKPAQGRAKEYENSSTNAEEIEWSNLITYDDITIALSESEFAEYTLLSGQLSNVDEFNSF